ncbi:MAG TPA: hypothetical protein VFX25_35275 [Streptosporangiaceae bacterium]|nr:hypothetical protein [Streptosporangiaceae bacterium]
MVGLTERLLQRADRQRTGPPVADLRTRAALTVAMALGVAGVQAHISRSIGADILSAEGDRRVILAVLDIQSHPTISPDTARALRSGLGKPGA